MNDMTARCKRGIWTWLYGDPDYPHSQPAQHQLHSREYASGQIPSNTEVRSVHFWIGLLLLSLNHRNHVAGLHCEYLASRPGHAADESLLSRTLCASKPARSYSCRQAEEECETIVDLPKGLCLMHSGVLSQDQAVLIF